MIEHLNERTMRGDLRERIIITALQEFRTSGIKSITMDDIAAKLKISKRTLYEIFEDKETLLKESIIYHRQLAEDALKELVTNSSSVLEVILKCYQGSIEMHKNVDNRFFEDLKKYPKVNDLMNCERERENKIVIDFMKKGVEQGLFRADINFEIIHFLLREQMDLLMARKAFVQFPFLEVYEAIALTYLRGISTEKGLKELDDFLTTFREKQMKDRNNASNEITERK